MTLLDVQLKALRYPHPVDLANTDSVRKLVIWLENLKIREYKIEDRKALSDTSSPPAWDAAFHKYLQDLQCPVPPSDAAAALQWLVAFALNLDYEDNAEKLGAICAPPPKAAAAAAAAAVSSGAPRGGAAGVKAALGPSATYPRDGDGEVFTDLQDPRVVAAVMQLVRAAQVEGRGDGDGTCSSDASSTSSTSLADQVMSAARRCVCELGPGLRLPPGSWNPGRHPRQALAGVPLGFEVEGETLSTAATALRLLYIRDLRHLQSQIDHAVVEMQEYTANPKTDSSLGKVGR